MNLRERARSIDGERSRRVAGGVGAVVVAAVVYLQYSFYLGFNRDSAIYVYGGQRFTHGVPPYASIMDPKGPVSGILCGFGVAVARLLGRSDVMVVRAEFLLLTIASVLGVYLLVLELCDSVVAALVSAAVMTSFHSYARFAVVGPDGHTPGTVFLTFALWLAVRRKWYWATLAAALAFCTWQPLFWAPVLVLGCALAWSAHRARARAALWSIAGGLTPLVALFVYYWGTGYPGKLFEGLVVFPLTGVARAPIGLVDRLRGIASNTWNAYGLTAVLLAVGALTVIVMAARTLLAARRQWRSALRDPVVLLLGVGTVVQLPYLVYDYIGPSHWYPVLPFAASGFGLLTARLQARFTGAAGQRRLAAGLLAAVVALTAVCAVTYHESAPDDSPFRSEQADSCAVQQALIPGTPLWVMGNPIPLVLLHRVNPDNYPYVGSGLDKWKIEHTPGGFAGWTAQITDSRASVVVVDTWQNPAYRDRMQRWLHGHGYVPGFIGRWRVYVTPAAHHRLTAYSLRLSRHRHLWPIEVSGVRYTVTHCTTVAAG